MISGVKDARGASSFTSGILKQVAVWSIPSPSLFDSSSVIPREKNERALLALFRNSNNATSYTCTRGSGRLSFEVVFFLMNDYAPADD